MKHIVLAMLLLATAAHAQTNIIAQWNFNSAIADGNNSTGTLVPSTGSGAAINIGGTTFTYNTGSPGDSNTADNSGWNLTTFATQGTGSGSAGAQFAASTAGFNGQLVLQLDFRQSGTASRYFQLQVSSDGVNFANVSGGTATILGPVNTNTNTPAPFFSNAGLYVNNAGGGSQTFVQGLQYTFAAGSAYENNASFGFRFVAVFDPGSVGGGTNYISSNAGTAANYATSGTARFDMVTVETIIPEPSTVLLLGFGGLALLGTHRRLRK
ncbi:MAG TPA: PEP-CTERM sorting domain-containing protein [Verrucomicrobiae bacterium]|nr:PEP-CTERM sorting domain-containing protein [Verrucomicrobiae bacterium]